MTDDVQGDVTPQVSEAPAPKWAPEVEQEARALGWKSPDEWRGEVPPTYIDDPSRYLEKASSFTPFRKLNERMEKREREYEERLRKIESVAASAVQRTKAEAEARIAAIQAAQLKAVEVGDVDQYKALKAQEAQAVRTLVEPVEPPKTGRDAIDPVVLSHLNSWAENKPWFGKGGDEIATNAAAGAWAAAERRGIKDPAAILREVDTVMSKRFPEYYPQAPQPNPQPTLEGGLTLGGGSRSTGFSKLPKDAQEAFKRFVARGLFTDDEAGRKAYVEDYNNA